MTTTTEDQTPCELSLNQGKEQVIVSKGMELEVVNNTTHSDIKTFLARPDDYPILNAGDRVSVEAVWNNLYGMWVRCRTIKSDHPYDLRPYELKLPKDIDHATENNLY